MGAMYTIPFAFLKEGAILDAGLSKRGLEKKEVSLLLLGIFGLALILMAAFFAVIRIGPLVRTSATALFAHMRAPAFVLIKPMQYGLALIAAAITYTIAFASVAIHRRSTAGRHQQQRASFANFATCFSSAAPTNVWSQQKGGLMRALRLVLRPSFGSLGFSSPPI